MFARVGTTPFVHASCTLFSGIFDKVFNAPYAFICQGLDSCDDIAVSRSLIFAGGICILVSNKLNFFAPSFEYFSILLLFFSSHLLFILPSTFNIKTGKIIFDNLFADTGISTHYDDFRETTHVIDFFNQ